LIVSLVVLLAAHIDARPVMAQEAGTPAAATPAPAEPTAAPPPTATAAPQAATPAAPAQTNVITLTFWYSNPVDRDIIELYPLAIGPDFVAGPQSGAPSVGTVDFPADGSPPTLVLGETTFTTYPRPDGVVERWTWFDDIEGARPGTLVMQLSGQGGAYQDHFGAATFVSRDEGGVGGVLTIALRPPSAAPAAGDAAAEAAPAEEPVAEDAAAEPAADAAAVQPDATVEPGTVILEEAPADAEQPVVEGEAPLDPAG
jgi:hypothetical protein